MSSNGFGQLFHVTTFGESHGPALGAVVEGCPAGMVFDLKLLQKEMERRRPGKNFLVSSRNEPDVVEVLSGVYEGKTLGTPIAMCVKNSDQRSQDYENIPYRSGHATDLWQGKFGHSDFRGSGRASGRETVARVMAGAVARMLIQSEFPQFQGVAFSRQLGSFILCQDEIEKLPSQDEIDHFPGLYPSPTQSDKILSLLLLAREKGESYGGVVEIQLMGVPAYLGQPVFHKLKSDLAMALMSVGGVCGVDIGSTKVQLPGSVFHGKADSYGGLRGGLSTGETIILQVGVKPPSSLSEISQKGRHDSCLLPRIIPVLQSMIYLVLADHILWRRLDCV